jgi:hypothetical protein
LPNVTISETERSSLIAHLASVHNAMCEVVGGFSPIAWTSARDPGEWSPAQVVEHTILVERGLMKNVALHLGDVPDLEGSQDSGALERLLRRVLPAQGKARASEKNSTFAGLRADAVQSALDTTLKEFSFLLEDHAGGPLKAIFWPHGAFGPMSAYLWLLYVPLHSERHLGQLKSLSGGHYGNL